MGSPLQLATSTPQPGVASVPEPAASPTPAHPVVVRAERLTAAYGPGAYRVWSRGPLELRAGEVTVLLGRNGTGKTLWLQTLATLRPPAEGRLTLTLPEPCGLMTYETGAHGHGLAGDPILHGRVLNRHVGFDPQCRALVPGLTLHQNVAIRAALGGRPAPDADAALAGAGLGRASGRAAGLCSGGEAARGALARAVAGGPALVALDEPFAMIDAGYDPAAVGLVQGYARAGAAVLVSLHDLDLAAAVGDRFWLLEPESGGRSSRLTFPFLDRDDPEGAGSGAEVLTPAPPGGRTGRELKRVRTRIRRALGAESTAAPTTTAVAVGLAPSPGAPPARVRFPARWLVRCAAREALPRGRRAAWIGLLALVAGATFAFCALHDLALGVRHNLDVTTPPDDPEVNRVVASPKVLSGDPTTPHIPPAAVAALRRLPRLTRVSAIGERTAVAFVDARGGVGKLDLIAFEPGDDHVAAVAPRDRANARLGLVYPDGQADPNPDQASLIVPRRWVETCYKGDPDRPPAAIVLRLGGVAPPEGFRGPDDDPAMRGWRGDVRVPIVVVDLPAAVGRALEESPRTVFTNPGFLSRIGAWAPQWSFTYAGSGGVALAPDVKVVKEVRLEPDPGKVPPGWQTDRKWTALLTKPFAPVVAVRDAGALVVRLDPSNRHDQLMSEPMARSALGPLVDALRAAGYTGRDPLRFVTVVSSRVAPATTPPPVRCDKVWLEFSDPGDVLPGEAAAQKACPALQFDVRHRFVLEPYRTARFVVDLGGTLLELAFGAGLLFVVGTLAFLHADARGIEAAGLRLLGLPSRELARLFLLQLGLLVVPACLLGLALARLVARSCDGWIAAQIATQESTVAAVFASCQGRPLAGVASLLLWATLALLLGTCLSVRLTCRKPIGDALAARA